MIQREGVSSLSVPELKVALRERGMRAIGVSVNTMRKNLSDWIDLSLKENIPPSLLVLSRALNLARKEELSMNAIQDTIAKLEPEFLNEVMLESGVRDNEIILESVQRQKQKIEQEEKEKRSAPVRLLCFGCVF
jgi:LETM1 and EF-hand domain-containing protein 1